MATHYLPSNGWYSTSNSYIFYRFKIDESISGSTRSVTVSVEGYKSSLSTGNTSYNGTLYLTINGTEYNKSLVYDTDVFYCDDVTRTYHTAKPSIAASTTSLSVSGYFSTSGYSSNSQGGTISLTSASANQLVYVRYQQADGSWGDYSPVINTSYTSGATVSWSRSADTVYKAASISYTATTSSKTSYVDVYRQTYTQTIQARYQSIDGTFEDKYETVLSETYYAGAVCSWTFKETDFYKSTNISYTVIDTTTKYIDIYRKTNYMYYDANGGVCAPKPTSFYGYEHIPISINRPTRSGYEFLGWSSLSDSSTASYFSGEIYALDESITILYAIWKRRKQNIYMCSNGTCYASEFVQGDIIGYGGNGIIYANNFEIGNIDVGTFKHGKTFYSVNICEGEPQN